MTEQQIKDALAGSKNVILRDRSGNYIVPKTTVQNVEGLQAELDKIAGDVQLMHYQGPVATADELNGKTKKNGFVYIASRAFSFTQDHEKIEVENGDMLICDGTHYAIVQGNINANSLIHNGEKTQNAEYTNRIMLATRDSSGVVTMHTIEPGTPGQVLTANSDQVNGAPVWAVVNYPVKGVMNHSGLRLLKPGVDVETDDVGKLEILHDSSLKIDGSNLAVNFGDGLCMKDNKLSADLSYEYTGDYPEPELASED